MIRDTFPDRLETVLNIKNRGDVFRYSLIKDLSTGKYSNGNGRKIGVVGHSVFFKVFTVNQRVSDFWDKVYDEETNDVYPGEEHGSLTMMNCEIHAD